MLLIGSVALEEQLYRLALPSSHPWWEVCRKNHTGQDVDYICTIEQYEEWCRENAWQIEEAYPMNDGKSMYVRTDCERIEFAIAWPGTTNETILQLETSDGNKVASLDTLLLLKLSHRYKKNSPHFLKTMRGIQLLREMGANVSGESMLSLLAEREKETYTNAHPKLNQKKSTFFSEADSFYVYEHDDIHKAVAVGDVPAYTKFAIDGQEVRSSKRKFLGLSPSERLLAGLEECYVLAIERSLVPHPGAMTRKEAFLKSLEKVCTSITSGWFREYCWENYDNIVSLYDDSYYDKFTAALEAGRVRKFKHD